MSCASTLLPSGVFVWDPVRNKPMPFTAHGPAAPERLVFQGTQYQPELCRAFEQHRRTALFQTLQLQEQIASGGASPNGMFAAAATAASCVLHFAPHQSAPEAAQATPPRPPTALMEWEDGRSRKRSRVWQPREDECLAQAAGQYGARQWKRIAQRVHQLLAAAADADDRTPRADDRTPRTADQCCQRWTRVLAPRLARLRWTPRRDSQLLHAALGSSGDPAAAPAALLDRIDWPALAARIAQPDHAACRHRFFHLRRLAKRARRPHTPSDHSHTHSHSHSHDHNSRSPHVVSSRAHMLRIESLLN